MDILTTIIGAVAGAIVGVMTAYGATFVKMKSIQNSHTLEMSKLDAKYKSDSDKIHTEREQEAFSELKLLLKERKIETERQAMRLDRLETEHTHCEKRYEELRQQSISDKIEIGVLKSQIANLQVQLLTVQNKNDIVNLKPPST